MPTPLLIISDGPTSGTGLGRITRDLAARIEEHLPDVFEVATLGYGGPYSRSLPFRQFKLDMKDWVIFNLPEVWDEFAGDRQGVVMTIWDASRLLWFSRPENCEVKSLQTFLMKPPFVRWGYFPIDATGVNDKLTGILKHTVEGYDRVLAYSAWAEAILKRTITLPTDHIPHGIDTSVFLPRPRIQARHGFGERIGARKQTGKWLTIPDDVYLIGIVATNQARKDFGLAFQIVTELIKQGKKAHVWIHTDVLERHWSVPALVHDFDLTDKVIVTILPLTDEQMSWCYSACDVTLGIGNGEGYGFPIFESLACGTPCIHGNYGGAAEHLPDEFKVTPAIQRIEGVYNCIRNNYWHADWVWKILQLPKRTGESLLPSHLDWTNLWLRWEEWLRKGVA